MPFFSAKCATYSCGFAPHKVYRRKRRFACAFVLTCLRRKNCRTGALMQKKLNFFKKLVKFPNRSVFTRVSFSDGSVLLAAGGRPSTWPPPGRLDRPFASHLLLEQPRTTQTTKKTQKKNLYFFKKIFIFSAKCATYVCNFAPHKIYRRTRRFVCAFVLTCLRRENCQMRKLM